MLLAGELLFANLFYETLHCSRHNSLKIGITFDKLRGEIIE